MAYTESENLRLKIQDDDEFNSILVTAENFEKIDSAYAEMKENMASNEAGFEKSLQAINAALGEKAESGHTHTAAEIAETADKKILTAAERAKLGGIATGATKNVVDGTLNENSTNPVENGAIAKALAKKAESGHTHTAAEIAETADKKILTADERTKLGGIATGATRNIVDTKFDKNSTNAIANATVYKNILDLTEEDLKTTLLLALTRQHLMNQGYFSENSDGSSGNLYIGELLIQWGFVKKANTANDVVETVNVSFANENKYTSGEYFALAVPITAAPQKISVGITSRAATGFTINHFRTSTVETYICWLTIGRGTKNATETDMASTGS